MQQNPIQHIVNDQNLAYVSSESSHYRVKLESHWNLIMFSLTLDVSLMWDLIIVCLTVKDHRETRDSSIQSSPCS